MSDTLKWTRSRPSAYPGHGHDHWTLEAPSLPFVLVCTEWAEPGIRGKRWHWAAFNLHQELDRYGWADSAAEAKRAAWEAGKGMLSSHGSMAAVARMILAAAWPDMAVPAGRLA